MTDPHYLSAQELLEACRTRALSPVEDLDTVEDWADAVEPTVNALSHRLLQEQARAAAVEAEARYAGRGGGEPRPLERIRVAAKEDQPITGLPLRLESLRTDDTPSATNAIESLNARYRRAAQACGHFPNETAALKRLYLATLALDPTGRGRQRWNNRWKSALNEFDLLFDGRLTAGRV